MWRLNADSFEWDSIRTKYFRRRRATDSQLWRDSHPIALFAKIPGITLTIWV
jgi:hypothetical protein